IFSTINTFLLWRRKRRLEVLPFKDSDPLGSNNSKALTLLERPGTTEETRKCVFPFIYNGKSYNSCTRDGREDGKLWCAITENYDVDKRLTFCTVTKTGCVFPFIYKGKSYESCTTMDHNEGKTWCATTPDYKSGLKWRLCNGEPKGY
uniref:Fibronectin type-II domain-containing protein n=1 Tax=Laticauda laticaudata TaxID=8630 RepID=A0A8C5RZM6_LATLA